MKALVEQKLATRGREVRHVGGPAGDYFGKADHIILIVAGTYPERMQLKNFAAEILVQPTIAVMPAMELGPIELELLR